MHSPPAARRALRPRAAAAAALAGALAAAALAWATLRTPALPAVAEAALQAEETMARELDDVTARLEQARFSSLLLPEVIAPAGGMVEVLAALERQQALRADARRLLARYRDACVDSLRALPAVKGAADAVAVLQARCSATARLHARLGEWQDERARRVEALVAWYVDHRDAIAWRDGLALVEGDAAVAASRHLRSRVLAAEAEIGLVRRGLEVLDGVDESDTDSPKR